MVQTVYWLILSATAATGLLAGASLDQSIKQLPARHALGSVAFSAYSRASDLANGVPFYGVLGVGAAALTITAALAVHLAALPAGIRHPTDVGAGLAVLHSLVTLRAAPINFSQRRVQDDPRALGRLFTQFARWQAVRAVLQLANFGVLLWSLTRIVAVA